MFPTSRASVSERNDEWYACETPVSMKEMEGEYRHGNDGGDVGGAGCSVA